MYGVASTLGTVCRVTIGSFSWFLSFFPFLPPSSFARLLSSILHSRSSSSSFLLLLLRPLLSLSVQSGHCSGLKVSKRIHARLSVVGRSRKPDRNVILLLILVAPLFSLSSLSHHLLSSLSCLSFSSSSGSWCKTGMIQRQLRNKRLMGFN